VRRTVSTGSRYTSKAGRCNSDGQLILDTPCPYAEDKKLATTSI